MPMRSRRQKRWSLRRLSYGRCSLRPARQKSGMRLCSGPERYCGPSLGQRARMDAVMRVGTGVEVARVVRGREERFAVRRREMDELVLKGRQDSSQTSMAGIGGHLGLPGWVWERSRVSRVSTAVRRKVDGQGRGLVLGVDRSACKSSWSCERGTACQE